MFRVVLITGDERRHRYVAARLAEHLDVVGVVHETKVPIAPAREGPTSEDQRIVQQHLSERDSVERQLLGDVTCGLSMPTLHVGAGESNSPQVFDWLEAQSPDFVVLYGSSIIRDPLLAAYGGRMINLHLGLSPYYRGSATNFWPLVNREPECVGATLHLAVPRVDAGPILAQVRPQATDEDRAHSLGTKALIAAAALLPRVLKEFSTGRIFPVPQDLSQGRVYRRSDFTADAVRALWHNLDSGMMHQYVTHRAQRCAAYPIRELAP